MTEKAKGMHQFMIKTPDGFRVTAFADLDFNGPDAVSAPSGMGITASSDIFPDNELTFVCEIDDDVTRPVGQRYIQTCRRGNPGNGLSDSLSLAF